MVKLPLTVEAVLHETGRSWQLRDRVGRRVAACIDTEAEANLMAYLVNADYRKHQRFGSDTDVNSAEMECVHED